MEKPNFLPEKYADLPGSKPVERAVQKKLRGNEAGPKTKADRVDAYMDRLEDISDDERGFYHLKHKILDRFTIDTEDPEKLEKIAEGLYESEKRIAIEQGRGADIQNLVSQGDILEHYKPLIAEKADVQRNTLSAWLNYLQENDAEHPMWFRYYVVRSLEKMGVFDKERGAYSKRTPLTVAPFPELNSEALGWVFKHLSGEVEAGDQEVPEDKKEYLEAALKGKDFAKLYALALIETAGRFNRESIEGEWKKYNRGGDWQVLENDLKGKGTGWCTAEGSAKAHLEGGDFYVYYTKSEDGGYGQPRIAIRMSGDQVGEIRGVNPRQELEPQLVDIAQDKYRHLPGGDTYDKKAADMREMTEVAKKSASGEPLDQSELVFLYELNGPIEGFGYDRDPRIDEVRSQRDPVADVPVIFDCLPEQIAHTASEINDDTKAYLGVLTPGIFDRLQNIDHIYTKFPSEKISQKEVARHAELRTGVDYKNELTKEGFRISDWGQQILERMPAESGEAVKLVMLSVADLGLRTGATTAEIYAQAQQLGLELCPAWAGPELRLDYKEQPMGDYMFMGMKQISDAGGRPRVFFVGRSADGAWLDAYGARPYDAWDSDDRFAFVVPRK